MPPSRVTQQRLTSSSGVSCVLERLSTQTKRLCAQPSTGECSFSKVRVSYLQGNMSAGQDVLLFRSTFLSLCLFTHCEQQDSKRQSATYCLYSTTCWKTGKCTWRMVDFSSRQSDMRPWRENSQMQSSPPATSCPYIPTFKSWRWGSPFPRWQGTRSIHRSAHACR